MTAEAPADALPGTPADMRPNLARRALVEASGTFALVTVVGSVVGAPIGVLAYGAVCGPKPLSHVDEEASRDGVRAVRVSA